MGTERNVKGMTRNESHGYESCSDAHDNDYGRITFSLHLVSGTEMAFRFASSLFLWSLGQSVGTGF